MLKHGHRRTTSDEMGLSMKKHSFKINIAKQSSKIEIGELLKASNKRKKHKTVYVEALEPPASQDYGDLFMFGKKPKLEENINNSHQMNQFLLSIPQKRSFSKIEQKKLPSHSNYYFPDETIGKKKSSAKSVRSSPTSPYLIGVEKSNIRMKKSLTKQDKMQKKEKKQKKQKRHDKHDKQNRQRKLKKQDKNKEGKKIFLKTRKK